MSEHLQAAADAADTIDWKIIAGAAGTFVGSCVIALLGWFKGKEKVEKKTHLKGEGTVDIALAGVTVQDNLSLRENTQSNRDLRDQTMMLIHCTERTNKTTEEMVNVMEDVLAELKRLRKTV